MGNLTPKGCYPRLEGNGEREGASETRYSPGGPAAWWAELKIFLWWAEIKKKVQGKPKKKNTVTGEIGNFVGGKKLAGNENRKSRGFIEGGVGEKKSGAKSAC